MKYGHFTHGAVMTRSLKSKSGTWHNSNRQPSFTLFSSSQATKYGILPEGDQPFTYQQHIVKKEIRTTNFNAVSYLQRLYVKAL